MKKLALLIVALLVSLSFAQNLRIDGSSTVYPVSLAIAEEFLIEFPEAQATVSFSGTGAGFSKFCRGEIEITGASRSIKQSEIDLCGENDISFVELPIAGDALTVITNKNNEFATCMTVDELRRVWGPESDVTTWSDIRSEWPAEEIEFYGAGSDSGTFDYFTEAIVGESGAIRLDYFPSEDDNVLVLGVEGNENAIGFLGYSYFSENSSRLNAVSVDSGNGCVEPSAENAAANTYTPLSRPLFVYASIPSLETNPTVQEFLEFAFTSDYARQAVEETGYLVFPEEVYEAALNRLNERVPGTVFSNFHPGDSISEALEAR